MLERTEMMELFARHKADPAYWTAARLSELYGCKQAWVEVLLQYTSLPVYANVEGEEYGVYAIKDVNEMK